MRNIEILSDCSNNETVYGILINDNGTNQQYSNLTTSKKKIEQLKRNLEDSDVSAVHIPDIIRDFIAEEACDKLIANSML